MDINASIDVGKNITSMLEKLAAQIGTTADKVFPWYVQQAHLEGITTLCAIGVMWLFSAILISISFKKCDFINGNRYVPIFIVGCLLSFASFCGSICDGPNAVRKMLNPNYYAMTMMTQDIGRLVK